MGPLHARAKGGLKWNNKYPRYGSHLRARPLWPLSGPSKPGRKSQRDTCGAGMSGWGGACCSGDPGNAWKRLGTIWLFQWGQTVQHWSTENWSLSWARVSQAKPGSWQTSQKICLCALDKAGQEGCDPGGREMEEAMKQNVGGKMWRATERRLEKHKLRRSARQKTACSWQSWGLPAFYLI